MDSPASNPIVDPGPAGRGSLWAGGLAAVLASTCCLGPLLLLSLGFSGAWIGNLTALEPYQPIFLGVALVAMGLAWRRIWRPAASCAPGQSCAIPRITRSYKLAFTVVAVLIAVALLFPFAAPWFY